MKKTVRAAVSAALIAFSGAAAHAEDWAPPGPIKLLIAFAAGGGADTQARMIASELETATGWSIIPEQATGKGGLNAINALNAEPGDGSAIAMIVTETVGYNAAVAEMDGPTLVTPITTTAGTEMAVVALKSSGYETLADVIEAARGGAEIRFGAMTPSLTDLAYVIGKLNDVEFNIITVRGGRAVMDGLNAGDMDVGFGAGIQAAAVAAGDMVELASAKSGALSNTPDAPQLGEFNVPFTNDTMFLIAGPAGMDETARDAIAAAISGVLNTEGSEAAGFIAKGFGGVKMLQGEELTTLIADGYAQAGGLLDASAE